MMFCFGMWMFEVDFVEVQKWVEKVIQGGILQFGEDVFIEYINGLEGINCNGIGEVFDLINGFVGEGCLCLSVIFVNWMKDYNDFCLDIIGILFVNGIEYNGMFNGLDIEMLLDNLIGIFVDDFSMVNQVIVKVFFFMMFFIVVEFELLLVEVVVCGWYFGSV